MSFGFFGIQFGWALQMANVSAIYEYLGANPEQIPILWLAAPLSGLIAQPVIGYMSDRTWGPLGRRRPYFLAGAIFSSIALVLMPNSSSLWMAAGLLWILDTSVNVSMEPFRAFVSDKLPDKQLTEGFAMQSFFIGLGAVVAALSPWFLNDVFGIENFTSENHAIPQTVKLSFYLGAAFFLGTVVWTIVTTKEDPPADLEAFKKRKAKTKGIVGSVREIFALIRKMPEIMRELAWVQFFTWFGMFCVLIYFPPAVAHGIFGATEESSQLYTEGIEWAGICIAVYNAGCFIFSLFLSNIVAITSRKSTHTFCLFCGGVGLISLLFVHNQYFLLLPMVCFGIAWSSILTMPYAMLSDALPTKDTGVYMGVFNAFIVIPQIIAALGLGWVMENLLNGDRVLAVVIGGFSLVVAALLMHWVKDVGEVRNPKAEAIGTQL